MVSSDDANEIARSILFPVLSVWWVVLGGYYYTRDVRGRMDLMVLAADVESHRDLTVWLYVRQHIVKIAIIVNMLTFAGLMLAGSDSTGGSGGSSSSSRGGVPWGWAFIPNSGGVLVLDLQFAGQTLAFGIYCLFLLVYAVHALIVLTRSGVDRCIRRYESITTVFEDSLETLLLSVMINPALKQFFLYISCGYFTTPDPSDPGAPHRPYDPSFTCWDNTSHILLGVCSIIGVMALYPAALHYNLVSTSAATDQKASQSLSGHHHHHHSAATQTYLYTPRFRVLVVIAQWMLCAVTTLLNDVPLAAMSISTAVLLTLFGVNYWNQPCLGSGRAVNHFQSVAFGVASYIGILATATAAVDDSSNIITSILLVAGVLPVAVVCYKVSEWRLAKLDADKFESVKAAIASVAVTTTHPGGEKGTALPVSAQRLAAHDLLALSVPESGRERIVEHCLAPIMAVLETGAAAAADGAAGGDGGGGASSSQSTSAVVDAEVRLNYLRTVGNLAASRNVRRSLIMINTSGRAGGISLLPPPPANGSDAVIAIVPNGGAVGTSGGSGGSGGGGGGGGLGLQKILYQSVDTGLDRLLVEREAALNAIANLTADCEIEYCHSIRDNPNALESICTLANSMDTENQSNRLASRIIWNLVRVPTVHDALLRATILPKLVSLISSPVRDVQLTAFQILLTLAGGSESAPAPAPTAAAAAPAPADGTPAAVVPVTPTAPPTPASGVLASPVAAAVGVSPTDPETITARWDAMIAVGGLLPRLKTACEATDQVVAEAARAFERVMLQHRTKPGEERKTAVVSPTTKQARKPGFMADTIASTVRRELTAKEAREHHLSISVTGGGDSIIGGGGGALVLKKGGHRKGASSGGGGGSTSTFVTPTGIKPTNESASPTGSGSGVVVPGSGGLAKRTLSSNDSRALNRGGSSGPLDPKKLKEFALQALGEETELTATATAGTATPKANADDSTQPLLPGATLNSSATAVATTSTTPRTTTTTITTDPTAPSAAETKATSPKQSGVVSPSGHKKHHSRTGSNLIAPASTDGKSS